MIITKQPGQHGCVTVDTVRSQVIYEIQGRFYYNPDVIADLSGVTVTQEGEDRVRVSGVRGLPPPPTLKVAIQADSGYQGEMMIYAIGLDLEEKARTFEAQTRRVLDAVALKTGEPLRTLEVQLIGRCESDPASQNAATAIVRVFAQSKTEEPLRTKNFMGKLLRPCYACHGLPSAL
jgi:hypothetical protein